jgi:hypothetical protein
MRWRGVNVQLLLNAMHPHEHLLHPLSTHTTSYKHVLHEELELARSLAIEGGGDRLLTMSTTRARATWSEGTRGRARSSFAFDFAFAFSSLLQLSLCLKGQLVGKFERFMRGVCREVNA